MEQVYIETQDLSVGYHGKALLKDIALKVKKGEILVLIGPNGAGKSTILKNIIREMQPISGGIYIKGKNVKDFTSKQYAKTMSVVLTEKIKTENHPLFDKLGIDDPGHPHYKNNSDVVQDFAALAAKHQREYEQQMAASRSRSNLPIQPQTESKAGDEEEGGRKDSMMRELSAEEFERSIGLDDLAQEKPGGEAEIKGEMEKELEADTSLLAALKNRNRRNQEVS